MNVRRNPDGTWPTRPEGAQVVRWIDRTMFAPLPPLIDSAHAHEGDVYADGPMTEIETADDAFWEWSRRTSENNCIEGDPASPRDAFVAGWIAAQADNPEGTVGA